MASSTPGVWDPWVRLTHWSVAGLVLADLLNEAGANPWHRGFGYAAAALVLARLAWGLSGRRHARLREMASRAARALEYIGDLRARRSRPSAGHTPLGACMAFALWTLVLALGVTGWMLGLDAWWGDEALQQLHAGIAYVLAGFAVVHVLGVVATSRLYRTNLAKGMITGRKDVADIADARD